MHTHGKKNINRFQSIFRPVSWRKKEDEKKPLERPCRPNSRGCRSNYRLSVMNAIFFLPPFFLNGSRAWFHHRDCWWGATFLKSSKKCRVSDGMASSTADFFFICSFFPFIPLFFYFIFQAWKHRHDTLTSHFHLPCAFLISLVIKGFLQQLHVLDKSAVWNIK